jgi:sugar lactone lactonase YvrE
MLGAWAALLFGHVDAPQDPSTSRLLWIDIVRGKLFSYDEATGDNRDLHMKQLLGTVVPVEAMPELCVVAGVKGFATVNKVTGEPTAMIGANPEAG